MTIDLLLGAVTPHICKGCGAVDNGLCAECFADIIDTGYDYCISCGVLTTHDNLCGDCRAKLAIDRAFVVGPRMGALRRLVGDFKFNSERGHAATIAQLLDATLPTLPTGTVVIPIPTIAPHIRRRGFGHTELVARVFARYRKLRYNSRLLKRATNSVQHGLSAADRRREAARAFMVNPRRVVVPREILLIDDIYTTGSTIIAASKLLRAAGVETINIAIVARQVKD